MNATIPLSEKAEFFDSVLDREFSELMQLDLLSGEARMILSHDKDWQRTLGLRFDFPSVMRHYLNNTCADSNLSETLQNLSLEVIGTTLEQQEEHSVFYTVRREDGSFLHKKMTFYHTDDTLIPVTIKDITAEFQEVSRHMRQLAEALSEARQELKEKNAFLSLMSRSIRTPLYSIIGLTQMAEDAGETTAIDSYLHKIAMSGSYMNETIDDILELRQIARGETELHPEVVELGAMLSSAVNSLRPFIESSDLTLLSDYEDVAGLVIQTDRHMLYKVIQKMLSCMSSYLVAGGRLELLVREVFRSPGQVTLEFSVRSRGIILDRERISSMFNPYDTLADHLNNDDLSVMDIALIILRKYAGAMGARSLTAVSDEAQGTNISLTLAFPLEEDRNMEDLAGLDPSAIDFSSTRVLAVDDNHINLEVVTKMLKDRHFIVTTARSGQEALEIYQEKNGAFDLILMDILMPQMDGFEATKEIRALKDIPGSDTIPIIAMTANAFRKDFEESMRAGMDAHLVKPIRPDQLLRLISVLLKKTE
ncbi:MAG: response regulator [Lachnospiraceae bacterium]|nr:response regulator [Lachnospiraceae bacterium]